MSLARQRAVVVRVLSILRALSPALARLRLVSAMRSFSDATLYAPVSHASVDRGWARLTTEASANTSATSPAVRRGTRADDVEARVVLCGGRVMRSFRVGMRPVRGSGGGYSGVVLTVCRACGRVPGAKVPNGQHPGYRSLPG